MEADFVMNFMRLEEVGVESEGLVEDKAESRGAMLKAAGGGC